MDRIPFGSCLLGAPESRRWAAGDPRFHHSREETRRWKSWIRARTRRSTSVCSDDLSGLDIDKDVLLAVLRRLDLDHVDVLAFLALDLHGRGLAGDRLKRDLRRLVARDLGHGRRVFERLVAELAHT